MESILNWLNFL